MDTILNFTRVVWNVLLYSLRTATFCWVAAALVAAVLVIRSVMQKTHGKKQGNNYCLEGMRLQHCLC